MDTDVVAVGAGVAGPVAIADVGQAPLRFERLTERVRVTTRRAMYDTHRVIAVPPTLAGRINSTPALPALRDALTQRSPHGCVIKCHAVYERPFWRDAGLSGAAAGDTAPVKITFDATPPGERAARHTARFHRRLRWPRPPRGLHR